MRAGTIFGVLGLAAVLVASDVGTADAQWRGGGRLDGPSDPRLVLELHGGWASTGRFLEQLVIAVPDYLAPVVIGERELRRENSFTAGGSVAYWPWALTGVQLGLAWASSDLRFYDDSGTDSHLLDQDGIGDLRSLILSLEVIRILVERPWRLRPYATAGVAGAWWRLTDEHDADEIVSNGDNTRFRIGATGAVGLMYRASERFSLRLEFETLVLHNPFDGREAFGTRAGQLLILLDGFDSTVLPIDEPDVVRMDRITLGVAYAIPIRR